MAVQTLEDHWRAMMVFKGVSGKPDDVFVNTWHFRDNLLSGSGPEQIRDNLMRFYDDYQSGDPHLPITALMPTAIVAPEAEIRVYNLGDLDPREPTIFPVTLANLSTTGALPEEVSICLSFYADRNLPRQRGRLYLGPLTQAAMSVTAGQTRVAQSARDRIAGRATELLDHAGDNVLHSTTWVVYSPSDNAARPVTNGWIDDALDTVRKRGPESTGRTLWQAPGGV